MKIPYPKSELYVWSILNSLKINIRQWYNIFWDFREPLEEFILKLSKRSTDTSVSKYQGRHGKYEPMVTNGILPEVCFRNCCLENYKKKDERVSQLRTFVNRKWMYE